MQQHRKGLRQRASPGVWRASARQRLAAALACGLLACHGAARAEPAAPAAPKLPGTPRPQATLAMQAMISSRLGGDQPAFALAGSGNDYTAAVSGGAMAAIRDASLSVLAAGHRWGIALAAVGRGDRLSLLAGGSRLRHRQVAANRIEFARPGVTEWFANGPLGLEQGWTISTRPAGEGELRLALAQAGDLQAVLAPDRRSLSLSDATGGRTLLCYAGLAAYDATGRELPTEFELRGGKLVIRVHDEGSAYPLVVDPLLVAKLTTSSGVSFDELGFSTALSSDGSTVVAGAWVATVSGRRNQGALYVFQRVGSGWSDATEAARLTVSDGAAGDTVGYTVSISADGSTIAAGAPSATYTTINGPGAAYVFVRPAGGWKSATETAKLTASDVVPGRDFPIFGLSVATSGDGSTIVVGAERNLPAGAVYLFIRPGSVWTSATETAKLVPSDAQPDNQVGHAVAISRDGSTVVAGANGTTVSGNFAQGAVYVFVRPGSGWASRTETVRLTGAPVDTNLGLAVAVSGDGSTVVAGAINFGAQPGPGAAYVFIRPDGAWSSGEAAARLTASDAGPSDQLGNSVAVSADGSLVLAGAPGASTSQGAAYEFRKPDSGGAGGAGQWTSATETAKLIAVDGRPHDLFGAAVAVSDDASTVAAGAYGAGVSGRTAAGATYVFAIGRPPCVPSDTALCLDDRPGDQRWAVSVTFTSRAGGGKGHAIPLAGRAVSHGGLFWFFGSDNPEMLIKVLDGCSVNQRFWVFFAATTNVGFTVTVADSRTGTVRTYDNPNDHAASPLQDTSAFACTAGDHATGGIEVRQRVVADRSSPPDEAAVASALVAPATACSAGPTTVCIQGRFQIEVTYQTSSLSGAGQAIDLQGLGVAQGGLFWFFGLDNPEMLIKVLDGCSFNQRFWVFYAATTNVGFAVTVTDKQTGSQRFYNNQNGVAALPLQDTAAFPCS